MSGSSDVAASGTGSPIHQMAIQPAIPRTCAAAGERAAGAAKRSASQAAGPAARKIARRAEPGAVETELKQTEE